MANLLKLRRWEAGMKQYELAEIMECSPPHLSMIENARIEPTSEFKRKVAEALGRREYDIFPYDYLDEEVLGRDGRS